MFSVLPLSVLHWYLPLTLQGLEILHTATFLSVNMNIYSLFAFALSASSLSPLLSVKLPIFCHFSFIFLSIVISPSHLLGFISVPTNAYCTEQYVIRPSVNMEILSSFMSGWERLMNVCGQGWGLFVIIHMQVLKSMLSWTLLGTGTVFSLKGAFFQF